MAPAFSLFFLFFGFVWLAAFGGLAIGLAALISVGRTPTEAFGPWWDNTRQLWLIGIVVSFVVPLGTWISGIMWFSSGRAPIRAGHFTAGRPFWAGPPKPAPTWGGYQPPGYPPAGYPPPGPAPPPPGPPATGG